MKNRYNQLASFQTFITSFIYFSDFMKVTTGFVEWICIELCMAVETWSSGMDGDLSFTRWTKLTLPKILLVNSCEQSPQFLFFAQQGNTRVNH